MLFCVQSHFCTHKLQNRRDYFFVNWSWEDGKNRFKAYLIKQNCYFHLKQNAEMVQTHLANSHLFDIFQNV